MFVCTHATSWEERPWPILLVVFERRVPRGVVRPEKEEITEEWRKLHIGKLHNLCSLLLQLSWISYPLAGTNSELLLHQLIFRSRGSSGSIVSDYGLDDRGSIPGRGRGFLF
jgi:hypothetical protein